MAKRIDVKGVVNRAKRLKAFRGAHSVFSRFWGVKPSLFTARSLPGPANKIKILVSLGRCPGISIANGPKGKATRVVRRKFTGSTLACDPSGTRLFVLKNNRRVRGGKKRFLGWVESTEYIPTKRIENAGSFKAQKWWKHEHKDEGGSWPKAFELPSGTIEYGKSTYRVGKWIRR